MVETDNTPGYVHRLLNVPQDQPIDPAKLREASYSGSEQLRHIAAIAMKLRQLKRPEPKPS